MHNSSLKIALMLAVSMLLAACGSDADLTIGTADEAGETESASVADDSSVVEFASGDNRFLEYLELGDAGSARIGRASFVLVDEDGELVLDGPSEWPAYGISISVWEGVDRPFETTLSYANYAVADDAVIGAGGSSCGGFLGNFAQLDTTRFIFQSDTLPEIRDSNLEWESDGCPPPPVQQDQIFLSAVEVEFDVDAITVISADGQRWNFRQVWQEPQPEPGPETVEPVETTTTTIEFESANDDSGSIEGTWQLVEFNGERVELGTNTRNVPELTFSNGTVAGNLGCNEAAGDYARDGDTLILREVFQNAARCLSDGPGDENRAENVLGLVIGGDVSLEIDGSQMNWSRNDVLLTFVAVG